MKFDKVTIAGFAVCIALLFAWEPLCRHMGWTPPPVIKTAPAASAAATTTPAVATASAAVPTTSAIPLQQLKLLSNATVANEQMSLTINPNTGDAAEICLKEFKNSLPQKSDIAFKNQVNAGAFAISDSTGWKLAGVKLTPIDGTSCKLVRMFTRNGQAFEVTQI
mgnify:CR=1 FL=1